MVIADTGYWLAVANAHDRLHLRAIAATRALREPLVTTWPVLTETCHILAQRLGVAAEIAFIAALRLGSYAVWTPDSGALARVERLMRKYADLPMDLADASLVLLAEHLGHGRILSADVRDFRTYRWKQTKPFDNLLLR